MMSDMEIFSGWGMGFGWIFMFLFWVLVIMGIIAIVKWIMGESGKTDNQPAPKSARQIIEQRYARGEIDREEFEQKKRDLEG